jgi:hypothetical protein
MRQYVKYNAEDDGGEDIQGHRFDLFSTFFEDWA